MNNSPVRLTQYSHGAGCGCKIAPAVLETILHSSLPAFKDPRLLVGNETRDDAAVYDLGNGQAVVSTTDFFMPIVDDPYDFGRIAATNAISDIYAMGGQPVMAIAILGWPLSQLDASVAQQVVEGGRYACQQAGIALAGGHSIDAPEPIFGLAVTGTVAISRVKRNNAAQAGCQLWLSKPLGIGILTTAEKRGVLLAEHRQLARDTMCQLNRAGSDFAGLDAVQAMTDVTGFGLMGHLSEICQGSGLQAEVSYSAVPRLPGVDYYLQQGCVPGGTARNFTSYGHLLGQMTQPQRQLLCDPQTSGGLLLAVRPGAEAGLQQLAEKHGVTLSHIGALTATSADRAMIQIVS
ncbi:selenide, water dikinase SelD [Erwinia sp. OLTSP20]|uniref:selenide, water dikinase SelD n=1 Tax=unclassified Erwinia TaxID=2622719 RepID=UPI000C19A1E2|nr:MULTISPECIES: selenide, water dikinase SelD [unclassified Erwinia]PIJ51639.1 selenide, water dikinase SelD [Erwinia sp. OAMSP11]PIJ69716.1 selenide, water dikinase SelD [Erwinia sp. OLSSP12]PIJ79439.1 selenide, water dikinase SelD [Erwinia sp. OLCASP19]PIJ86609.1 selenide, water dikinase SelD [Erwinia sp. OLMTSP26]PIJ88050.1 selenide, water dikinase SelD [Erwinia sp. OLMDSP33]